MRRLPSSTNYRCMMFLPWQGFHSSWRMLFLTLFMTSCCQPASTMLRGDYDAWRELHHMMMPEEETPSSSSSSLRSFVPLPHDDEKDGKQKMKFFYEDPPGQWNLRYHDHVGLVDLPVPKHFRLLSRDRIIFELQWQHQKGNGTLWSERVILELLYYNIMKSPIRDDTLFDTNVYKHPKAAWKQQQRHHYHYNTGTRRTYQDTKRDNALAAATTHRIAGLGQLYHSTTGLPGRLSTRQMDTAYGWLREEVDICEWEGVVCGDFSTSSPYPFWNTAPKTFNLHQPEETSSSSSSWTCDHCPEEAEVQQHVTKLELPYAGLVGILPNEIYMLQYLHRLDLRGNRIHGSLPTTLRKMQYLQYLDLTRNDLSGILVGSHHHHRPPNNNEDEATSAAVAANPPDHDEINNEPHYTKPTTTPPPPSFPENIREIWLGSNQLNGTIPLDFATPLLLHLDLSKNRFTGSLPRYGRKQLPKIVSLLFEDNFLTGKLPPKWAGLTNLEIMDVGGNILNGTIPTLYGTMSKLRDFNIATNTISGGIPTELMQLANLESLMMSQNRLRGTLPAGDDTVPHRAMREPEAGYKWSQLTELQFFHASDNFLTSTIPPDLFYALSESLQRCVYSRSRSFLSICLVRFIK
jgi:hypothetical protein